MTLTIPSNLNQMFRSERSKTQTFGIPLNKLILLTCFDCVNGKRVLQCKRHIFVNLLTSRYSLCLFSSGLDTDTLVSNVSGRDSYSRRQDIIANI